MASEKDVTISIGVDASGVDTGMRDAQDSIRNSVQGIQNTLQGAFEFAGLDIAVESIKKVGEALKSMGDAAINIQTMSSVLGVTTAQFQTMELAAEEVGVGIDIFERAAEKLKNLLNEAHDGSGKAIDSLHKLGITNEELADPTFKINDLLMKLHDGLLNANTATDLQNALLEVLGSRAIKAIEALEKYEGTLKGTSDALAKINGLSTEQISTLANMGNWWKELSTWIGHAGEKIAVFANDTAHLKNLNQNLLGPNLLAQSSGADSAPAQKQADSFTAMKAVALRAYQGITDAMLAFDQQATATAAQGSMQRVELARAAYEDTLKFYGRGDVDEVRKAFKDMEAAQREYEQVQSASLSRQAADAKQKNADDVQLYRETMRQLEANFKELEEVAKASSQNQMEAQLGALRVEQGAVDEAAANHKITAQQEYQQTLDILQRELVAQMAHYRDLEALAMGDSAKLAQIAGQESNAQLKYLESLQQAHAKMSQTVGKDWKSVFDGITSSLSSNISQMLRGTESLGSAMKSIMGSVMDSLIEKGVQWASRQIAEMIEAATVTQTTTKAQVLANAGVAASAAMASVASIPLYGWALAPAVGAETYADALGFSAFSGFDIPKGLNPRTQLHEKEMVLPAKHADVIRNAADGGGFGKGGHTFNIHAMDSRSVQQMLHSNSSSIARALKGYHGRGGR